MPTRIRYGINGYIVNTYDHSGQQRHQLVEHDNRADTDSDERRRKRAHDNLLFASRVGRADRHVATDRKCRA